MTTVTTRELKQNPAAAIRHVLETGEPATITSYGKPTGVVMMPEMPVRRTWVPGHVLAEEIPPLGADEAQAWRDDLAESRAGDFGRDFCGDTE